MPFGYITKFLERRGHLCGISLHPSRASASFLGACCRTANCADGPDAVYALLQLYLKIRILNDVPEYVSMSFLMQFYEDVARRFMRY